MKKPQITTTIGAAGIFNQFLIIFNDIKVISFWGHVKGMTCGELYLMLAPIVLYLWAIFHNEDVEIPRPQ